MYNKIASLILNSGKASGLSDVFIAQPDALKENLAGKLFILAEIGGKKTDGRKIFDFLVSSLEDNYYNDEKILLRGKIEGLKIENIFEASLAKTNRELLEFLTAEKLKFNPAATNIILGVIYENKLYFSSFGKNRALLIYHRGEDYEIINVEASAADLASQNQDGEAQSIKAPQVFSSVISGEIPIASYFVFASEALPEYLSGREMVGILTKLPPIVAAEQIKNVLSKINTFVPFLGIIIKNTVGLAGQEVKEETEENLSAHSSISSLNYTEQKTEKMLAPAGLISFGKVSRGFKSIFKNFSRPAKTQSRKNYRQEEERRPAAVQPPLELGRVKNMNIARADSFMLKEKIIFRRRGYNFGGRFKKAASALSGFFQPRFWSKIFGGAFTWVKGLNRKSRPLLIALLAVVVIFVVSISVTAWNRKQKNARDSFLAQAALVEDKENQIDYHLMYNDEDGSRQLLNEAQALLGSLPREKGYQQEAYDRLAKKLQEQGDRIQKIVKIETNNKVNDLAGLGVNNLVWADGKVYAAAGKVIYGLTPNSSSTTRIEIATANTLTSPQFDRKDLLYYWDGDKVAQYNIKTGQSAVTKVSSLPDQNDGLAGFEVFNSNLYIVAKNKNQIYRYAKDKNGFSTKTDWLKESADLSQASDLAIDGSIYVLKADGEVLKFYKGKKADYKALPLSPAISQATKLIVGSQYLYIFDPAAKLIAVLGLKDGHLVNQYRLNFNQPQDVAIDEAGRSAYVLDGEAVYKVNLNQ